jgi:hypothetical protein
MLFDGRLWTERRPSIAASAFLPARRAASIDPMRVLRTE